MWIRHINDEDINLSEGTLKITDDKGTEEKDDDEKFEYISAGGLASKTVIETKYNGTKANINFEKLSIFSLMISANKIAQSLPDLSINP